MKLGGLVDVPLKICESDEASAILFPSYVTLNDPRDDIALASFVTLMSSTLGPVTLVPEIETLSWLSTGMVTDRLNLQSSWVNVASEFDTSTTAVIALLSSAPLIYSFSCLS